jgi:hypothetical protein
MQRLGTALDIRSRSDCFVGSRKNLRRAGTIAFKDACVNDFRLAFALQQDETSFLTGVDVEDSEISRTQRRASFLR